MTGSILGNLKGGLLARRHDWRQFFTSCGDPSGAVSQMIARMGGLRTVRLSVTEGPAKGKAQCNRELRHPPRPIRQRPLALTITSRKLASTSRLVGRPE